MLAAPQVCRRARRFADVRRAICMLALLINPGAFCTTTAAQQPTLASEEQVRAAFLFQLAQYVHWPPTALGAAGTPLRFCVLAQDSLLSTLEPTVRGKSIQGRPIIVQKVTDPEQLANCHLAFIGFRLEKQIRSALATWTFPPVLLVGETSHFAEIGGMVNLLIQSGRVTFEINVEASEKAHLEFRSQLLRFARIVSDRPGDRP